MYGDSNPGPALSAAPQFPSVTLPSAGGRIHTLDEVSAITRVPAATLRFWRHKGIGPRSFKLGRRVVYREDDVLAWIDSQYASDAPPAA